MTDSFKPYIPASSSIKELSIRSLLFGIVLSLLFAVGNSYLALKVGTTISASIPAAMISMAFFRVFFKKGTVLENNIVQTTATVGEGLATGVTFTVPALIFLGDQISFYKVFLLASLGGILGILFMIPMRRYIIVKEHRVLPFPEGTACAAILKVGDQKQKSAMTAFWGLISGGIYKICSNILFLWKEIPSWTFSFFEGAKFSIDATPTLLGVGYIIGFRIAAYMFGGGLIGWWVLIPLIKMFGSEHFSIFPSTIPVTEMTADEIWKNYIIYIGAGAVAVGGLLSLFRVFPLLIRTIHFGVKDIFNSFKQGPQVERTDEDIPFIWILLGSIAIILTIWLTPIFSINLFTVILLVVLGFFFVAVTSITVGIVGSTSNPVSGMTITTLLITCLAFVALGWTERIYLIAAITMSCVSNVAISLAGTTSQDLKTGHLLGSTPKKQQIAEIVGIFVPALALGWTIYVLNEAYTLGSEQMPAPQATLMYMIVKGVLSAELPYTLVGVGIVLALILELLKIPILPFAIGLYLPLSLSSAIIVGGIVSKILSWKKKSESPEGILLASGLIGGDACMGIIIASLTIFGIIPADKEAYLPPFFSLFAYLLLAAGFIYWIHKKQKEENNLSL